MLVRLRSTVESFRDSLFFLPALFVLASVIVAQGMLELDARLDPDSLPSFLRFTVESARALLSTVAGATITVTGIVFALTALSVQLASSQFSPRVVRGFLRDRFAQGAIGFMSATFTYSLMVLRAVRTPGGETEAVVPSLSSGLALVLAVGVVIMILAYVDHTAQSLQSTRLIGHISEATVALVVVRFPDLGEGEDEYVEDEYVEDDHGPARVPSASGTRVAAARTGWLKQVNETALLDALPPGGTVRVDVRVGSFLHAGQRLCTRWTGDENSDDSSGTDSTAAQGDEELREAFAIGSVRTMQQDVAFGVRQLVDVALRALSSGINDATTAYECIVNLGAVLYEILRRDLPPTVLHGRDGRLALRPTELTHRDYVERAFEQIRRSAAPLPDVSLALIRTLSHLVAELEGLGLAERAAPLRLQVRLVVEGVAAAGVLPRDLDQVRAAAAELNEFATA